MCHIRSTAESFKWCSGWGFPRKRLRVEGLEDRVYGVRAKGEGGVHLVFSARSGFLNLDFARAISAITVNASVTLRGVLDTLVSVLDTLRTVLDTLTDVLGTLVSVLDTLRTVLDTLLDVMDTLIVVLDTLLTVLDTLADVLGTLVCVLDTLLTVLDTLTYALDTLVSVLDTLRTVLDTLSDVLDTLVSVLGTLVSVSYTRWTHEVWGSELGLCPRDLGDHRQGVRHLAQGFHLTECIY